MGNKGHIYAFDLDKRRLGLLKRLTTKAGCTCIEPLNENFLETDPNDPKYADVNIYFWKKKNYNNKIYNQLQIIFINKKKTLYLTIYLL